MKTNDEIKTALIANLKSRAAITSLLTDTDEIRESQWQGTNFVYPAVRLAIRANLPSPLEGCPSRVNGSVLCYSENASSLEAEQIAAAVAEAYHMHTFSSSGVRFSMFHVSDLIPAIRQDERTWRSEVQFTALAE